MTAEEKADYAREVRRRALAAKAETEDPTTLIATPESSSSIGSKRRRDKNESDALSASKQKHVTQDEEGLPRTRN
ncbi:hypothetical protein MAPG_01932 [Magnaporthiopsis poae ATCC 64411]|uniref:Uncharacterized protein n=1 Tax=Magnaporthiopsis poae (strain ATCC 64411 / 73-15) TaxID=644358 RepID=A0A0C4DQ01_MAGP6|nr:hypothetical protein MAPG_01932 [Magnaporthiopsis poae ATCC 64411]